MGSYFESGHNSTQHDQFSNLMCFVMSQIINRRKIFSKFKTKI